MKSSFLIVKPHPLNIARPAIRVWLVDHPIACPVRIMKIWPHPRITEGYRLPAPAVAVLLWVFFLNLFRCEFFEDLIPNRIVPVAKVQNRVRDVAIPSSYISMGKCSFPNNLVSKV